MSEPKGVSRRKFLVASTAAAAGAGALGAEGCGMPMPTGPVDAGAVSEWMIDQARSPSATPMVIIVREAAGFYAYSRTCTHQACTIPVPTGGRSQCPCHNSAYNQNGDVLMPAPGNPGQTPLPHYVVTFTGMGATARVMVDMGMVETNRAARVAPPA